MEQTNEMRAGVVCLGIIGGGVAASLAASGRTPVVYNRTPDIYKKYAGVPPQVSSPAEVAKSSDVIMMAPFDYRTCELLLRGEEGILSEAREGMIVCCLSTIEVGQARKLYALCRERGVSFLDVGVTPGALAAEHGLVAMCGGDEEAFNRAKPVLDDWSSALIYCGGSGAGMATKIARNMNTYGFWAVTGEAYKMAVAAGVDGKKYLEVLARADQVENMTYKMIQARSVMPDNCLPKEMQGISKYMDKDLHAALELGNELGLKMPVRDCLIQCSESTFDGEEEREQKGGAR